jgi:hypothetical protein
LSDIGSMWSQVEGKSNWPCGEVFEKPMSLRLLGDTIVQWHRFFTLMQYA